LLGRRLTAAHAEVRLIRLARSRLATGTDPVAREVGNNRQQALSGEFDGGLWTANPLVPIRGACFPRGSHTQLRIRQRRKGANRFGIPADIKDAIGILARIPSRMAS
jgi:hypothetical protein